MVLTTIEARKMILRFASEIEESKFHLARNFERAFGLYFSVMKRRVLVPALLALLLPARGFAQRPQGNDFRRGRFSRLSMDEQARFRSAHDMAMRDPPLAATRKRYEQTRNEYGKQLRE